MNELDTQRDTVVKRPWVAPKLTTLDISETAAGASPNIVETVLTNDTFAIS